LGPPYLFWEWVLTVGREEQDGRSFFRRERVRLGEGNIHFCSGGVIGNVLIGTTMSLDGLMNDRNGDRSRLYPDLEELHRTEVLQEEI
jgi:hypothetical protein